MHPSDSLPNAELAPLTSTIIQSSRSRSLPSGGPNLGKPLCLRPHLAPQMAGCPWPMFYYSLPIAASAVAIPMTSKNYDDWTTTEPITPESTTPEPIVHEPTPTPT